MTGTFAQNPTATLRGRVRDELGGMIAGAKVTAVDGNGLERVATTNERGEFVIGSLRTGLYIVRVAANGFALFESANVAVGEGKTQTLDV
ncbi:MAG: carboxypeptidase-like regulatory domain-containing protein, partial [Acidobacteria bacterium]|nr:carboxypeptidase-like regulatory domain-containing protein [Acidobacteriota bacterium]